MDMEFLPFEPEPATVVDFAAFKRARTAERPDSDDGRVLRPARPAPNPRAIEHRRRMLRHLADRGLGS